LLLVTVVGATAAVAEDAPRGRLAGGEKYDLPPWFKKSFLALREDAKEAGAHGRHAMLFMHLEECPYCARMLNENFWAGETKEFMQKHFDVIGIDIRGSNPVEWLDGKTYTEQELAAVTKVVATPTVVFLDANGKVVLRLNGYRQPQAFRQALAYVQGRHYEKQTLASFVEKQGQKAVYQFRSHPKYVEMTNFKGYTKPLAILFEDKDCADCEEFHTKTFTHPEVQPELEKFTVVRLDAYSTSPIIDIDGRKTTPKDWAKRLSIVYRPGIVLFNEGKERARMDGMLYRFHFKELLRYVSGQYYHEYQTKTQYNAARREELLQQGVVIDYSQ
jgi:thioredoxin-related protein